MKQERRENAERIIVQRAEASVILHLSDQDCIDLADYAAIVRSQLVQIRGELKDSGRANGLGLSQFSKALGELEDARDIAIAAECQSEAKRLAARWGRPEKGVFDRAQAAKVRALAKPDEGPSS